MSLNVEKPGMMKVNQKKKIPEGTLTTWYEMIVGDKASMRGIASYPPKQILKRMHKYSWKLNKFIFIYF